MKKTLIALLSVSVVMLFTVSAFALHQSKAGEYTPSLVKSGKSQITIDGEIRIRGDYKNNTSDFKDKGASDNSQTYDQRVRLGVKGNVSANTFGVVELETGENTSARGASNYAWGSGTDKKRDALYIRQAYIAHQTNALGTPAGFKAGHLVVRVGNGLFFDHSSYGDDGFVLWVSAGPGEVSFTNLKASEGTTTKNDDVEFYVLGYEAPLSGVNLSADLTYVRSHSNALTVTHPDTITKAYDEGEKFYNLGLRADADLKVVKVKADVEFQTGEAKDATTTPKQYKSSGFATQLGVEANAGPVTIRGGAAYGSGDDVHSYNKDEGFRTYLTDNQYYTFVYGYSVKGASGTTHTGLENTMFANVGVTAKPMADLKVSVDGYYLKAVRPVALMGATKRDKDLGYELDGKVEYQIDSNLAYYIEAGYLVAGDAYNRYDTGLAKNVDADNAYRVRHGLLLKF